MKSAAHTNLDHQQYLQQDEQQYLLQNHQQYLKQDEQIEDLLYKDYKIIQKKDEKRFFRFGVDAVLLAGFAGVKKGDDVVDLGTGSGIIPVLMGAYTEAAMIKGLEIQDEMADMAARSLKLNKLDEGGRAEIVHGDIRNIICLKDLKNRVDVVTCNPPYVKSGGGLVNENDSKSISRHEILCDFSDVAKAAAYLLKEGGNFYLIHRPERLADIFYELRNYRLEPKNMRFVHPREGSLPNMILIKATKGGSPELKMMPSAYIYDKEGNYIAGYERMRRES